MMKLLVGQQKGLYQLFCLMLASLAAVPMPAAADPVQAPADAAASFRGTRLITLGTGGGPIARRTRSQPANLLQVDDRVYLIDAGDGTSRALVQNGFTPAQISRIFITHLHLDHTAGLAPLLGFNLPTNRGTKVDIYGPPGTEEFVDRAVQYLSIPIGVHQAQSPWFVSMATYFAGHDVEASEPRIIYQDDKLKVTAVPNSHFIAMSPEKRPLGARLSYSYRFDTADRSIVVTGDTGPSESLVQLARGADMLVSEVQDLDEVMAIVRGFPGSQEQKKAIEAHMREEHVTPEQVGEMGKQAGVKLIVLTHLSTPEDAGVRANNLAVRARAVFGGPVVVAEDGAEY
ncbi:MBL fold metallo-hydrolase [Sphingobium ummariense]